MAKKPLDIDTLAHKEAKRRNIPTAEYESVMHALADSAPGTVEHDRLEVRCAHLQHELARMNKFKEHYGMVDLGEGKKAMVEFSSPNIAKPLGVHHLLSTVIGQSVANILSFCNYQVITANFLGDWGTQFGKLIYAFKNWGDRKTVEKDPLNELLKLYVKFHDEAEKDPALEDKGREEFKKLEEGDEQNRNLWLWIREESIKDLERLYARLGVHFQEYLPESLYEGKTKEIIEEGKAKNVFVEGEKGALVVKFENEEYPPYLIQKADGTTLYATRDIASIGDRIERFHPAKIVYVVDVAQSLHFKQLFATAHKLGLTESELVHVVFGRMSLPEGKMSTRKGTVILLDELIKEAMERAAKVVQEKSLALTDAEKEFIVEGVALGAIKYQVLSQNRETNLTFDWDRMLALDGDTAPYLQYAYARVQSIFRKGAVREEEYAGVDPLIDARVEARLGLWLLRFGETAAAAARDCRPNIVAGYLYELAARFTAFYGECPVLKAEEPARAGRLLLCRLTARVLAAGLRLLGIEVSERM